MMIKPFSIACKSQQVLVVVASGKGPTVQKGAKHVNVHPARAIITQQKQNYEPQMIQH